MSTATAVDPTERARELLGVSRLTNRALTSWLHGLPGVDQVGCEARAAALGTRSIKTTSKAWAIDTAISMIDLTTLEGADTPGKVRGLAAKALVPDPTDATTPRPAAVWRPGAAPPHPTTGSVGAPPQPDTPPVCGVGPGRRLTSSSIRCQVQALPEVVEVPDGQAHRVVQREG